ncbi:hypothetical protein [Mycolicibacterium flavescens]|uniref:MmpS3 protein n=1 Tax=Mycolicibacterium flavescens TaxID=1776 RepID=A0A1E3RCY6_MYCFV|nr:hypothetical protein [Mycolicibacterium flavescens]ODQ87671.1 hypothetical protein BHQ18_22975 [Mycolicibacterium flavescens]
MNRPYTAASPYSLTPTERIRTYTEEPPADGYDRGYGSYSGGYSSGYEGLRETERYGSQPYEPEAPEAYDKAYDEDYDEFAPQYDEERIDRRWMWIAGIAGVILFVAIGTTGIILGGGDSGSVSATATSEAATSAAPATSSAPRAGTAAPLVPSLPPETVTTVSPSAEATPSPVAEPSATQAPPAAAPPPVAPAPRTITYRVTGTRPLLDLVTIIYTDGRGALQTDVNVALPWAKTVVLDPGVELKSVTATSVTGQLNCSITDAAGTLITAQNNNAMIATCTQ